MFTQNLKRHVDCPPCDVEGDTVRQVLDAVFQSNPRLGRYIIDDRGAVRRHMVVFVNGQAITDRISLADPVPADGEVYVMQALSGG